MSFKKNCYKPMKKTNHKRWYYIASAQMLWCGFWIECILLSADPLFQSVSEVLRDEVAASTGKVEVVWMKSSRDLSRVCRR